MTDKEKERIADYRRNGMSYLEISKLTRFSINTIKSYCRRCGLVERNESNKTTTPCEQCGKAVSQTLGRKHKRFCSGICRTLWWNAHQDEINKKSEKSYVCRNCGKTFSSYGNKVRKYCFHACYIAHRYGV